MGIYFDYEAVARAAGMSEADLAVVSKVLRDEFPRDDMLWELHILRVCMAIRDGHLTVEEATGRKAA